MSTGTMNEEAKLEQTSKDQVTLTVTVGMTETKISDFAVSPEMAQRVVLALIRIAAEVQKTLIKNFVILENKNEVN